MRCKQCASNIKKSDKYCPACGAANPDYEIEKVEYTDPFTATAEEFYSSKPQENYKQQDSHKKYQNSMVGDNDNNKKFDIDPTDETTFGLAAFAFLIPIIGFVLHFIYKALNKSNCAKYTARWAWIGTAVAFVFFFVVMMISISTYSMFY